MLLAIDRPRVLGYLVAVGQEPQQRGEGFVHTVGHPEQRNL